MPEPLPQSILCPILIGRDAQIEALTRLLALVRSGQGQIALISGEAGIGKSRLVAAVA
jgi:predicted ATPase